MVARVGTFANQQVLIARMMETQQRVYDGQTQVGTEKKSQTYFGIASDVSRLLNLENERGRVQRFIANNSITQTTLKTQLSSVEAMDKTARNMRSELISFVGRDIADASPEDVDAVRDIQSKAFAALSEMEFYLNQKIDGKYIFGGGKNDIPPVSIPYDSLDEFQNFYDGVGRVFPSTRVANLADIEFVGTGPSTFTNETIDSTFVTRVVNPPGDFVTATLDETAFGNVTFTNVGTSGKITAGVPGAFQNLQVGQTFLLDGTGGSTGNNGVYTITNVSSDGSTITLDQNVNAGTDLVGTGVMMRLTAPNGSAFAVTGSASSNNGAYSVRWPSNAELVAAGINPNAGDLMDGSTVFVTPPVSDPSAAADTLTFTSNAFLSGLNLSTTHRVSETQTITLDVSAIDPGFEKVIRALGILAQDDLIQNPSRVQEALGILNDAIEHSSLQPTEMKGDLQSAAARIATNLKTLNDTKNSQTELLAFLENRLTEVENVNITEAAVKLNDDVRALEVSFATLSRIQQLSLTEFL